MGAAPSVVAVPQTREAALAAGYTEAQINAYLEEESQEEKQQRETTAAGAAGPPEFYPWR